MLKEPMLAAKVDLKDLDALPYPLFWSPKMDGYRAFSSEGVTYSRKLKPIRNQYLQSVLASDVLHGLDGEMVVGPPNADNVFRRTSSGITTFEGQPNFKWWIFDDFSFSRMPFQTRIRVVQEKVQLLKASGAPLAFVKHFVVRNTAELLAAEDRCLSANYEGIMLRTPDGFYKEGRCGKRDPWLIKMKRFVDGEAVILEVHEKLHNDNPAEINELGRTKRSSHKANKRAAGTLGGLTLQQLVNGKPIGPPFRCPMGKGWDDPAKAKLWHERENLPGQIVVFESLPCGVKDRPRFPKAKEIAGYDYTVKGFRDDV